MSPVAAVLPTLPALSCPAPDRVHPAADLIGNRSAAWLTSFGLYPDERQRLRLQALRIGGLIGRILPDADVETAVLFADFHHWLFAFDDAYCDEGDASLRTREIAALTGRLLRVLEVPGITAFDGHPFVAALRDVRVRLGERVSPRQVARWIEGVRAYFHHQLWESANRVDAWAPDLEEYLMMRPASGGMASSIALLDIGAGEELPQAVVDHPRLRALSEMCAMLVCFDNDILSAAKERERVGDERHNLLFVLAPGGEPAETVHLALPYRDAVMSRFTELAAETLPRVDATTARFIGRLQNWVHANIAWSLGASRYANARPVVSGCGPTVDAARGTVPPVHGTAWWWDVLPELTSDRLQVAASHHRPGHSASSAA